MLPPGARGTVRPRVAVVPSGVDVDEWRRARDNFTASGGQKKRHAFFYCCLVNHQGLLDLVELFPTLRSSLHGATLTAASLLPDAPMNAETLAVFESLPWARYAGVLDRASFEHELLSAETLIYLSPDSRHLPLLEAMMADIAILMPRLEPWHPFAPLLGEGRALILERDAVGRNMMDVALVREVCENEDRLAAVAAAARAYAEERSLDAAARAWAAVFEEVRQARFEDAPSFKLAAQHRAAQAAAAAAAAAEGAEGGSTRPAGQQTGESLQAGLLVLGGWLAGSVWLLVAHLRHRVWSPPLSFRSPHGRVKQA
jgi:glycosyltransferase involved in cell wall biosynthesis